MAFWQAEDFLWAVRCHLHLIAGRPVDVLSFDMQVEVARRMGYADGPARRGVEYFMQHYFRHATRVGELTRIFLTELEARHVRSAPLIGRLFRRRKKMRPGFLDKQGRLSIEDAKTFLADPAEHPAPFRRGAADRHPHPPRRDAPRRREPGPHRRRMCSPTPRRSASSWTCC